MPIRVSLNGRLAISTIVFATDFSAESSNSGRYAAALATHFGAELVVIHAFVMSQGAMDAEARHQGESSERRDLIGQLQQTSYTLANSGQRVQVRLLGGNPSDVISRFADGTPESLLVLGTHGGGRVERQLIGSVAERTLPPRSMSHPNRRSRSALVRHAILLLPHALRDRPFGRSRR